MQLGLNIKDCIAQCYDRASIMSGHLSGVQSRIRERVGSGCVYIHCYAHRLINLVVVNTASSKWLLGLLEAVYHFVTASSLRHDKFVECQKRHKLKVMEIPKSVILGRCADMHLFGHLKNVINHWFKHLKLLLNIHMMGARGQKPLDFLGSFKISSLFYSCGCSMIFLGLQTHTRTLYKAKT